MHRILFTVVVFLQASLAFSQNVGQYEVRKRGSSGFTSYGVSLTDGQVIGQIDGVPAGITISVGAWGSITGNLVDQEDLQAALDAKLSTATAASTYAPKATTLLGYGITDAITAALAASTYSPLAGSASLTTYRDGIFGTAAASAASDFYRASATALAASNATLVAGGAYLIGDGTYTLTLPASPAVGDTINLVQVSSWTGALTLDRNGQLFAGASSSPTYNSPGPAGGDGYVSRLTFVGGGTGWRQDTFRNANALLNISAVSSSNADKIYGSGHNAIGGVAYGRELNLGTGLSLGGFLSDTINVTFPTITIGTTAISGASSGDILVSNGSVLQKLTPGAGVSAFITTPTVANLNTAISATLATTGANTFTAKQTITQGTANASVLASTGYSLTGSSSASMIDLSGTLNTSADVTVMKVDLTDTASGSGTLLVDYRVNGSSAYKVSKSGQLNFGPSGCYLKDVGVFEIGSASQIAMYAWGGNGLILPLNRCIYFSDGLIDTRDLALGRDSAAVLQLGLDGATPITQSIKAHDATGADHAAADLQVMGGRSTGTGNPGNVVIRTATAGSTGSSVNDYATRIIVGPVVTEYAQPVKLAAYAVEALPLAANVGQGAMAWVTDATTQIPYTTVTGGGSSKVLVISDGENWIIH